MESNTYWQFILLFILIGLSAFSSATEAALMSLNKIRIRHLSEKKVKNADLVNKLIENPSKLLGSILVANNIVNIAASALATSLAIHYLGSRGVGVATGIMTFLILVFGEITPKSIAIQHSEFFSLKVARLITLLMTILNPIVSILLFITNGFIQLLGGKSSVQQPFITEDEIRTMVDVSHDEGLLAGDEKQMIHNVFEFGDSQVLDVMTPRTDVIALEIESSYEKIMDTFRTIPFSRIPIYKETIDNIVGLLYVKDFILNTPQEDAPFHIQDYMREPFFTFEFKRITELFQELRAKRLPIAIVLDEYGGTAGIVTMEDLIEEIVGDIRDEYDDHEKEIEIKENECVVDGSMHIDTLAEILDIPIESEDFNSIGGFILGILGHIPKAHETIEYNGIQFIIEEMDRNRIKKLRIRT